MDKKRFPWIAAATLIVSCLLPVAGYCQETQPVADILEGGGLDETATLMAAIVKVVGALAVVIGVMVVVVILVKRSGLGQGGLQKSSLIKVLDTRMIAPKKYIAVLDIAGEFVAVGVTDQHVDLLTKIDKGAAAMEAGRHKNDVARNTGFAPSFASLLGKATKKADGNTPQKYGREK